MSYGASFGELFRRAAKYVDKILRGASPSDLPVEQASKFELAINLKTAQALGLTIPHALLVRATRSSDSRVFGFLTTPRGRADDHLTCSG